MKKPLKAQPRKRNLAAKALSDPRYRPKVAPDPKAYKRKKRVEFPPEDDDQIN